MPFTHVKDTIKLIEHYKKKKNQAKANLLKNKLLLYSLKYIKNNIDNRSIKNIINALLKLN